MVNIALIKQRSSNIAELITFLFWHFLFIVEVQ